MNDGGERRTMTNYVAEFGRDGQPASDGRLDAAAFHRNHAPIWSVLEPYLSGRTGDVLEAGSGTGQHVVHFAARSPDIVWWPSDIHAPHLASIAAWRREAGLTNIREPLRIDLADPAWGPDMADKGPRALLAIVCANVVHIAPWPVAEGLLAGAVRTLRPDGRLFLYGPFKRDGRHTAVSNAVFDTSLRRSNAAWGVRDIGEIEAAAGSAGLGLERVVEMPANNLILVLSRAGV